VLLSTDHREADHDASYKLVSGLILTLTSVVQAVRGSIEWLRRPRRWRGVWRIAHKQRGVAEMVGFRRGATCGTSSEAAGPHGSGGPPVDLW
jgi:HPt (histidine-containing phosphotransfer) domain-containing protein